jgi:hypothetical protein
VLSLLMCSVLASVAPARAIVLDVRADGASETTARVVRDEIAQGLAGDPRLEALSSEDLRRVVSLEAERTVLGCTSESCLAEVGQALGARYVVHGSLSVIGALRILRVNVLDTDDNRSVARETIEARADEDLLPQLRSAIERIKARLLAPSAPTSASASTSALATTMPWSPLQTGGLALGALGAAAIVGGAIVIGQAWPTFTNPERPLDERQQAQFEGQASTIVLAGGVVAALGGATLVLLGGDP